MKETTAISNIFDGPKKPARIADIVAVLNALDDATLETVRIMVLPLKEKGEIATAG